MKSILGPLALVAASVNAIMLPPSVAFETINGDVGPPFIDPYTNILLVACPGCLYAQPHEGGFIFTTGVENALLVNISVGSNPASLELNGVQFYPPLMTLSSEPAIPTIVQIPASVPFSKALAHLEQYPHLRLTSWAFHAGSARTVNDQGHEIISIGLHLGALEMQDIYVPDLSITALKDVEGNLAILNTEWTSSPDSPLDKSKECNDWPLLCKWKSILASKLSAWNNKFRGHGCGGKGKGKHGKPMIAAGEKPHDEPHRPHGHHHNGGGDDKNADPAWHKQHHHHRHHHSKLHRVLHAIARVLLTVLVPVLVGVVAGMLLYLVGYVVGASLAFVVARVFGSRRAAGYRAIVLVEDGDNDEEEEGPEPRASTEKFEYTDEFVVDAPPEYVEVEADADQKS